MNHALSLIRHAALALAVTLGAAGAASAQLSIGISAPNVSIGIHLGEYPQLVRVPNYPVYYAPQLRSNFFFYDGLYWVYQQDEWYASDWYDGPWGRVDPQAVPYFVLRIPVRYYRNPPTYFRGWRPDAPPRWDAHWGPGWSQQRPGWDRWDRRAVPRPAPLPSYQRQYKGDRYPQLEQQHELRDRHYRYEPREAVVREHVQQPPETTHRAPEPRAPRAMPAPAPAPAAVPAPAHRPAAQERAQRPTPDAAPRPAPAQARGNDRVNPPGPAREAGKDRGKDSGKDSGRDNGNDRGKGPDRGNGDDHGPPSRK